VIATEDEEIFRILDLVGQEQADGLKGLLASIDVVTQEEVVSFRWEATVFEKTQQIVILTVDVAADLSPASAQPRQRSSGRGCPSKATYLDWCLKL
jgi:hypothetical protein